MSEMHGSRRSRKDEPRREDMLARYGGSEKVATLPSQGNKKRHGGGVGLTHILTPPTTPSRTDAEDPTILSVGITEHRDEPVQTFPGGGDRAPVKGTLATRDVENFLPAWYMAEDGKEGAGSTEIVLSCLEGRRRGFRCLSACTQGVKLSLMVDSGATVNLLKADRMRKIERHTSLPSRRVNVVIKGLGGSSIHCKRAVLVPLEIGDEIICTWVLETPNNWQLKQMQRFDGLLGQEFLNLPGNELVLFRDGKAMNLEYGPTTHEVDEEEVQLCCMVQSDVDLSPGQAVSLALKPITDLPSGTALTIPEAHIADDHGCITAKVTLDPSNADILPMTISNYGEGHLSLTAGDEITFNAHKVLQENALVTEENIGAIGELSQQKLVAEVAEAEDDALDGYLKYDPSIVKDGPVKYDEQRASLVLNRLSPSSWELEEPEQVDKVKKLIRRKQKAFHLPTEPLTTTHVLKHHIDTGDAAPVRQAARFIPFKIREAVESETTGLLRNGQAVLTDSPWNSNIVMVKRKHGEHYRMCTDSRSLNNVTAPVYFPIPRIEEILARAAQCTWFSSLDLRSAYSQVPLTEESIPKTAFSTHSGKYAYKVMPFGLIGAPATFQKLMHIVFNDLFNDGVSAFLDNIDLFHMTFDKHLSLLEAVLDRLIDANLKLSPEKTFLFRKAIKSLGHQISHNSIRPDQDKIEAIKNFLPPTTKKGVRSFIGMANYYRRFIARFSDIAAPLTALTRDEVPFKWEEKENLAFQELKDALSSEPVLTAPDFDKPYTIFCDASDIALGSVLTQYCSKTKKYMPLAYHSRMLKGSETNYLIYEKEALSVVEAATKFKPYIWGQKCEIFTDNSAITYLFGKSCEKNSRAARWAMNLQAQNIKVSHVPGRCNVVADCLSRPLQAERAVAMTNSLPALGDTKLRFFQRGKRAPDPTKFIGVACQVESHNLVEPQWDAEALRKGQEADPVFGELIQHLMNPAHSLSDHTKKVLPDVDRFYIDNGLLYKKVSIQGTEHETVAVPKTLIGQALRLSHEHISAGHPGTARSIKRASKYFFWPKMTSDIKSFVGNCDVCHRSKTGGNPLMPLKTYPTPDSAWETVSMDLVGPLPLTEAGNRFLLVMVDHLSRFCALEPLRTKSAEDVADGVVKICAFLNFPRVILSDNAKEFRCTTMAKLAKHHGFTNHYTAVYHPASNGLCERKNRDVVTTIRATIEILKEEWDKCLPAVQLAVNTGYHRALGDSPYFVMFGRDDLRSKLTFQLPNTYNPDLRYAFTQKIYDKVREKLKESQEEYRRYRSKKVSKSREPLTVGARVFIKNIKRKTKLDPLWIGPMRINQKSGSSQYELTDLRTGKKILRHGEHIIAKRQVDINRWAFPECDEPFPQEVIDNDYDPVLESTTSREEDSPDDLDWDSDEDSLTDADFVDDPVGDADSSQGGGDTEARIPVTTKVDEQPEHPPGILKKTCSATPKQTHTSVNFDPIPRVKEFSTDNTREPEDYDRPGPSTEPEDVNETPTNMGERDEDMGESTGESVSSEPHSTPSSSWLSPQRIYHGFKRKLRSLPRKNYKALHLGKH